MQRNVTSTSLVTIYATTLFDRDKAEEHPPMVPYQVDDEERRNYLMENAARFTSYSDIYRELIQVSFMVHGRHCDHFMLCNDMETRPGIIEQGMTRVSLFDSEFGLLRAVIEFMSQLTSSVQNGPTLNPQWFAGWKIFTDIWPMLINKAFGYRIPVPLNFCTGLDRRFPDADCLLDLCTIYTQGASTTLRKLPALSDVLIYWNVAAPESGVLELPDPQSIEAAICDEPLKTAVDIEQYLRAMYKAVVRYYNINEEETCLARV